MFEYFLLILFLIYPFKERYHEFKTLILKCINKIKTFLIIKFIITADNETIIKLTFSKSVHD